MLNEAVVLRRHSSYVFYSDGSEPLSASVNDTMVRWNMTSFEMIGGLIEAQEASVESAVYAPDGQFIASGSDDGSVETSSRYPMLNHQRQCLAGSVLSPVLPTVANLPLHRLTGRLVFTHLIQASR